jgi:hypothetical protein
MRPHPIPLVLLLTSLAGAAADPKLEEALAKALGRSHWYGVYMMGEKSGYARIRTLETKVDGRDAVESQMDMRMKITTLGQRQNMRIGQYRTYFRTGELHSVSMRFTTDVTDADITGTIRDGKMIVASRMGRLTNTQEAPAPKETLQDLLAADKLLEPGAKVGDSVQVRQFDPSMMKELEATITLKGTKTIVFGGVETEIRMLSTHVPAAGVTMDAHVDAEGVPLELTVSGVFVLRLEPEEKAKDVRYSSDIVRLGCVKLTPHPVGVTKLTQARFRMTGIEDEALCIDDDRQTWTKNADGTRTVTCRVPAVDPAKVPKLPVPREGFEDELSPTLYVQTEDERIRKKAAEIMGEERDAWAVAKTIRAWVDLNVKDVGTPAMSNAVETLDSLKGDCTEHTVLFVALARAAGLPARECTGVTAIDKGEGLYYHAWPEVWVGQWVAMDPTLHQDVADATHIKFAHGSITESFRIIGIIGKLKAEYLAEK